MSATTRHTAEAAEEADITTPDHQRAYPMSKYKYGRHASSLTPAARDAIRQIAAIPGIARVLIGHIRAGRGKSAPRGFARVQRIDDFAVHLICCDDGRLIELVAVLDQGVASDQVVKRVHELWPADQQTAERSTKGKIGKVPRLQKQSSQRKRWLNSDKRALEPSGPISTIADFWPSRSQT